MFRYIMIVMSFLLSSTIVNAAQQATIITRFSAGTASGRFAAEVANMLNDLQKDYEFKVSTVIGANGEAADQRALVLARSGQPVLSWMGLSAFTFNRYIVGNTYDRDNDFIILQGMTSVPFSIQVAPDSPLETFDDFLKYVNNKPIVYMGNTASSSSVNMLMVILKKSYNIDNVKELPYERPFDITRAMLVKEIDFTIFNPADVIGQKQLVTSSPERLYKIRNVPTGKEVGMSDFNFMSQTIISVPKEQKEFGEKMSPLLARICYDQRFLELVDKNNYFTNCLGQQGIKQKMKEELDLIEKYKDSMVFK